MRMSDDEACILTDEEMERCDGLAADLGARMADMSREELMAEVRYWHGRAYLMGAFRDRLMRRCAMLRKLIVDAHSFWYHGGDCTECNFFDECSKESEPRFCYGSSIIHERMRALGIEVGA